MVLRQVLEQSPACTSSLHLCTALHLVARQPQDFWCAKPHLAPLDHTLHYHSRVFRNADGSWMDDATAEGAMHRLRKFSQDGDAFTQGIEHLEREIRALQGDDVELRMEGVSHSLQPQPAASQGQQLLSGNAKV